MNVNIMANYESVAYPVPVNVPFISSLIASQWDHSQQWKIPTYEMFSQSSGVGQQVKHEIDLNDDSEYAFIRGHQIDGRCLFPATGYLTLVWKTFAKLHHYEDYRDMSVLFEQIQIHRATICSLSNKITFYVNILPNNGLFEIIENHTVVVTGRISISEQLTMQQFFAQKSLDDTTNILQSNEIYRDFNLRGYEYAGLFRGIHRMNIDGAFGELTWQDEWISYLDTMLQVHLIPSQGLQLPTRIDSLRIHPQLHVQSIPTGTSLCPVYVDAWNSLCFSGGVELFGLHCTGTSKKAKQQNTILESYEFVPWDDETILDELKSTLYLIAENTLSTSMSVCQIGDEALSNEAVNFYLQQPSIKTLDYTLISPTPSDHLNQKIHVVDNFSAIPSPVDLMIVQGEETDTIDWEKVFLTCKANGFLLLPMKLATEVKNRLQTAGFISIARRSTYHLWRKVAQEAVHDKIIEIDDPNYSWIEQIKASLTDSTANRIWLVSKQFDNGILGFFQCLRREPNGQALRYDSSSLLFHTIALSLLDVFI